ncbi:acyl-CoA dehydrogenase family protein [Tomitella biformata]|uniref:acyl-CoA dehydrogenase family protein n=1 Tax=Tomitella biformata TaxID=630403 RepID=UPI00046652C7|nr:acyl-CoA dehydrogenase family protein [Tomitella biformata]
MVDDCRELDGLRAEVRGFLAEAVFTPRCDNWMRGVDRDFSRAVAERGWIGMSWPREHGGGGRTNVARLVVTEELLRAGAPVAGHWTADRQIGPSVLRHGTPELRAELLPAIRRGDTVFCLGLSESEAGSDLAAVRTRASRVAGGWEIDGAKIWTTSAHHATHAYVLARTDAGSARHAGLTEFLVDMDTPGITVRPILDLVGEHHFNELLLESVFVPEARVLGVVGEGWAQVTEQLAFERGGVERYLSTYPVLRALTRAARRTPDRAATERVGALAARLVALRRLALDLARAIDGGHATTRLAAELKLLGTDFERDVVEDARYVFDVCGTEDGDGELLLDGLAAVPGGAIRGGASEVMRTVIARAELGR